VPPVETQEIMLAFKGAAWLGITIDALALTRTVKEHYHTWDGVLESEQSALSALFEMCDSFRCWPVWYGEKFNFVIDKDDTPVHTLSVGNMIEFSQAFTPLSEIPYKIISQFVDEDDNFNMRSLIARSTSTTLVTLNEQTLGLKGLINKQKAERETIFKLNKVTNVTHLVNFKCGMDMIHATAGDIINIQDDVPSWGQGGRILSYNATDTSIVIDADYTFADLTSDYRIKYQTNNNAFVTATVTATTGVTQTIQVEAWPATNPCEDAVFAVGIDSSYVKPFRLMSVSRSGENEVDAVGIEHISSLYTDEPTITVIEDTPTLPPAPPTMPSMPRNITITAVSPSQGIGFVLGAEPALGASNVQEIVVQMSSSTGSDYETIATISVGMGSITHIDNNLILNTTYYFKFFCRTYAGIDGIPAFASYFLSSNLITPSAPSGIKLTEATGTIEDSFHLFDGMGIHVQWMAVTMPSGSESTIIGYRVAIYYDSISLTTLLRTVDITAPEFWYTLQDNIDDAAIKGSTTPYASLILDIRTIGSSLSESAPTYFRVRNSDPSTIAGLIGAATVGGAKFEWTHTSDSDHRYYQYETTVGGQAFTGTWTNITDNTVLRTLTAAEIVAYGEAATIAIRVRNTDWYAQSSSYSATSAVANTIADNIFQIVGAKDDDVTGTVADLWDGDRTSGGITIT